MALRLNNSYFRVRDGVFRSIEPVASSIAFLGQIYRIVNTGGTTDSYTYPKIDGSIVSTGNITSGSIVYILAKSGSVKDSPVTGSTNPFKNLTITNLLITSSIEFSPTFTEQIITATGAGTWTKPAGITEVIVECWSGGGAGGGATGASVGGNGGAGGQYSRKLLNYESAEQSIPYVVGAGGIGSTGNGTSGSNTTWNSSEIVSIGGAGGLANQLDSNPAQSSFSGSIGDVVYIGSDGGVAGQGIPSGIGPGSGGSGPGSSTSQLSIASLPTLEYGGGSSGNTGIITTGGTNGAPGNVYAGGGEGAARVSGPSRSGGSGAQGLIRIIYKTDISTGIVLNLNAENASSYPGTGTTWFDISGNGYNATMNGTVPFVNTSPKYFNYTNTANYFVGNSNLTSSISDAITITSWIKVTDITKRSTIFDKYQVTNPPGYSLEVGTAGVTWVNTVRFYLQGTTALNGVDARGATNAITQGNICMVTVTFDYPTRTCRMYVNDSEITFSNTNATAGISADWSQSPNNYSLGSFRPEELLDAAMQQYRLAVYNRVLSPTEVSSIFNLEKSIYGL